MRGDGSYPLTDAETGELFGTFSAGSCARPSTSPCRSATPPSHSAKVLLIDPA